MQRRLGVMTVGLFLGSVFGWGVVNVAGAADRPAPVPGQNEDRGNNGTAVHFEDSPSVAAGKAKKEHKLVFVLHVSGLFEDPCKT